jgi:BirA family transcriptional regulator, biotin operon repressor / biotin---[acetyl-CoA-carboxylase] ligase
MNDSDLLLPREIVEGLDTEVLGRKEIVHLVETDSTNARARKLAEQGAPEGTLVVAERQTQGRGRKGRAWFSPSGAGLYTSLVLRPSMPPHEATRITFLTAVAAAEALLHLTDLNVRIKWPNDILVNGKKIAGILTEISTGRGGVDYAVVGLGMNVNTQGFPDDISEKATSVFIETGERFPRAVLLREYLRQQEACFRRLRTSGFEPILGRWKELADSMGKEIRVRMLENTYEGWVEDIDPEGILILRDRQGISRRILAGDVSFV